MIGRQRGRGAHWPAAAPAARGARPSAAPPLACRAMPTPPLLAAAPLPTASARAAAHTPLQALGAAAGWPWGRSKRGQRDELPAAATAPQTRRGDGQRRSRRSTQPVPGWQASTLCSSCSMTAMATIQGNSPLGPAARRSHNACSQHRPDAAMYKLPGNGHALCHLASSLGAVFQPMPHSLHCAAPGTGCTLCRWPLRAPTLRALRAPRNARCATQTEPPAPCPTLIRLQAA